MAIEFQLVSDKRKIRKKGKQNGSKVESNKGGSCADCRNSHARTPLSLFRLFCQHISTHFHLLGIDISPRSTTTGFDSFDKYAKRAAADVVIVYMPTRLSLVRLCVCVDDADRLNRDFNGF